jgi:putative tricarboxylic transport membrane protein
MKAWIVQKDANLWTSLFLMIFSGAVINGSFELEIGTPHSPGSGFMIFGAATVLGLLALHQFIKSLLAQKRKTEPASEKIHRGRILSVIVANIVYIFILQPVGYLLSTFFLIGFLFQVHGKGKWVSSLWGAALTSFLSYLVFSRMLQLNLPRGLIPFF